MNIHRSKFTLKYNQNIQLYLDRVWCNDNTFINYSLITNTTCNTFTYDDNEFFNNLKQFSKPCRSKLQQVLFNLNGLQSKFEISTDIQYCSISVLEYEAERVKLHDMVYSNSIGQHLSPAENEMTFDIAKRGEVQLCISNEYDESVPFYDEDEDVHMLLI